MNASTTGGDAYSGIGRVRVSSEFVELKVAEPYLSIELTRTSVERGKKGEIVGTLKVNAAVRGQGDGEAAATAARREDAGAGADDHREG